MTIFPVDTGLDARNRAWRTFVQGLLVDVLLAVSGAMTLAVAAPDFAWSRAYWLALGLAVAKTALSSAVSYVSRRVVPPQP